MTYSRMLSGALSFVPHLISRLFPSRIQPKPFGDGAAMSFNVDLFLIKAS
jgi:hypothetical protein